jgi:hypothetical protein
MRSADDEASWLGLSAPDPQERRVIEASDALLGPMLRRLAALDLSRVPAEPWDCYRQAPAS